MSYRLKGLIITIDSSTEVNFCAYPTKHYPRIVNYSYYQDEQLCYSCAVLTLMVYWLSDIFAEMGCSLSKITSSSKKCISQQKIIRILFAR